MFNLDSVCFALSIIFVNCRRVISSFGLNRHSVEACLYSLGSNVFEMQNLNFLFQPFLIKVDSNLQNLNS